MRAAIVRALHKRNLELDRAQLDRIEACADLDELDQWFERALVATSAEQLFT